MEVTKVRQSRCYMSLLKKSLAVPVYILNFLIVEQVWVKCNGGVCVILLFCVVHKEFNNCITLLHIIQSVIIAVALCVSTFVESKQLQINQEF